MAASVQWNGDAIVAAMEGAIESGLQAGADVLLDESNRIVPIEYGDLAGSGVAVADGDQAAVGYTSVYAARQHEEVGWSHNNGRQAKYLETALHTNADRIQQVIAGRIGGALS